MKLDNRYNLTSKLAYIAGFVDGEGCIRLKKSNKSGNSFYVTLQVTNSDPRPLNKIKEVFGGKVFFQEKKATGKVIWQYYSTTSEATDTLRVLVGFLVSKKSQAELAIQFQDNQATLSPEEKAEMAELMSQMKKEIIGNIYSNPELLTQPKED